MSESRTEAETTIISALVQQPRTLVDLSHLNKDHFTDRSCRLVFMACKRYHERSAMKGRIQYAPLAAIERELDKMLAKTDDPARTKTRRRARKAASNLLDEVAENEAVTEHELKDAVTQVVEAWLDASTRSVLLELADEIESKGAEGIHRRLQEASAKLAPAATGTEVERLDIGARGVLIEHEKAKHQTKGIKIPTFDPMLTKVTGGGGKKGRMWIVAAYAKGGKAMPLDAKVLTPKGWKQNGDLKIGDEIIDPDGGTASVVGVYPQGEKPCYRVSFSDGTQAECCDEHLWLVNSSQRNSRGLPDRVMTLGEIMAFGNRYFIPSVRPIEFDRYQPKDLPLDPYLLGVLIGDGHFGKKTIELSSTDDFIVSEVRKRIPPTVTMSMRQSCCEWGFKSKDLGTPNGLAMSIDAIGLRGKRSHEKFVPERYLWNSVETRLAVLQGLMDSDGYQTDRIGAEFTTASPQLAEDIAFLARSLGCVVRATTRTPQFRYKGEMKQGRLSYRLKISAPDNIAIFRLPRKVKTRRTKPRSTDKAPRTPKRAIVGIEFIGMKPQQCIAVNSSRNLYVTNDFIVTHNTQTAVQLIYCAASHGYNCAIVTSEQTTSDVRLMLTCRHSHNFKPGGLNYNTIEEGKLSVKDEATLRATVNDLRTNSVMGKIHYFKTPHGTKICDVRSMLESIHERTPLDMVMIDHTGLFSPSVRKESASASSAATMMEIKDLALNFGNDGLWVVACHQISRDGYEKAEKRGGYYIPADLANTAEAERSCDLMLYAYRDEELIDTSEIRIGVALDRYGPGEIKGWNCFEHFASSAILPIKAGP